MWYYTVKGGWFSGSSPVNNPSDASMPAGWIYTETPPPAEDAEKAVCFYGGNWYQVKNYAQASTVDIISSAAHLTKGQFRDRLTFTEKLQLDNYDIDGIAPILDTTQKAYIRTLIKDFESSAYINVFDPQTVAGIYMTVSFGIISPGNIDKILAPKS